MGSVGPGEAPAASLKDVEKLREYFASLPESEQCAGWEEMWEQGITPWDRSKPNPALVDTLNERTDILGPAKVGNLRKRALVPGCGRGYDVMLLASYGYDAYGVDGSETAIDSARRLEHEEKLERKNYPILDPAIGPGKAVFLEANFFEDEFLEQIEIEKFDLIYDYTFLCALPPFMRSQWALRMSNLLGADGILICVEFPLGKPKEQGGPPYGVTSENYLQLFKTPGVDEELDSNGVVGDVVDEEKELKRVAHWCPKRSHHAGQGKDMVSMWQHLYQ